MVQAMWYKQNRKADRVVGGPVCGWLRMRAGDAFLACPSDFSYHPRVREERAQPQNLLRRSHRSDFAARGWAGRGGDYRLLYTDLYPLASNAQPTVCWAHVFA